ncbi:MAG: UDP-N-acetylenolpyruvoylglucosamine reductase [Pelagibaca sp.]|nr:UDP-N-acetylenolpyruvoylglucosamine reductase [Pelagibaca sp.]|tara:strand:+ start:3651 stop:4640 length:990 start_codon:yes stop_codon:yes gene_type:complete
MAADLAIAAAELRRKGLDVSCDVSLKLLSRWRIGGNASVVVLPASTSEVSSVICYCNENSIPYVVVGDTSNLLFSDDGFCGVVVKIGRSMSSIQRMGTVIKVEAGRWVPSLARYSAAKGLSGLEHTAGIPGTVGGLVCMNGGSQRKGIGSSLNRLTAVMKDGSVKVFQADECEFAYRSSVFQDNGAIITEIELELGKAQVSKVRQEMLSILKSRRLKFPLKLPNCGSVFASNPAMYDEVGAPGFAIEQAGLKGHRIGGAQISPLHANFFVNTGSATAKDMIELIAYVHNVVRNKTGFSMHSEVRYVTPELGTISVTDYLKDLDRDSIDG